MTIQVTQGDIDQGQRMACYCCPVAIALRRVTGQIAEVHYGYLALSDGRKAKMPNAVRSFVKAFDGDDPVQPFVFDVEWTA